MAASRGALRVLMVEKSLPVFRSLKDNAGKLGCANVSVRHQDGLEFVRRDAQRFDVIFLDPPFQSDYLPRLLELLPQHLSDNGVVYVESGAAIEVSSPWQVLKSRPCRASFLSTGRADSMIKVVYPGTFDPITSGHEDVVRRATGLFGEVIVAVAKSRANTLFTLDERVEMAREVFACYANVRVEGFDGLLMNFVQSQQVTRGVARFACRIGF